LPSEQHALVNIAPLLHVAMQMGPSHHPTLPDVWRMASEDSDRMTADRPFLLIVCTVQIVTAH